MRQARIFLLAEGGRSSPPPLAWHTLVKVGQCYFDARITFTERCELGEWHLCQMHLLDPDVNVDSFELWEAKKVGIGEYV